VIPSGFQIVAQVRPEYEYGEYGIEHKWVWIHSPLIVTAESIVVGSTIMFIGELITYGVSSSTAAKFFIYLILLNVGLVLSYHWYKK